MNRKTRLFFHSKDMFSSFESDRPSLVSREMQVSNDEACAVEDGTKRSLVNNQDAQYLIGDYTKTLTSVVCDVDMGTYQNMLNTTSSRCSTTRAA
jgi:hypothetical protein